MDPVVIGRAFVDNYMISAANATSPTITSVDCTDVCIERRGKYHCLVPSLHLSNEEKHKKKQEYRDYFFNRYFYNKKFNMGYSTSVYDTHFYYGMIFSVWGDRR